MHRRMSKAFEPGRRLYLIDAENLEGTGMMTSAGAQRARRALVDAIPPRDCDLVVVGTSHPNNLWVAADTWGAARQVWRHGHDGADLALLDVLDENIAERFAEVVLASGDGIFLDSVVALTHRGVRVTVVEGVGEMSRRLRMASHSYTHLTIDGTLTNERKAA
jgi:hypothetical protein